MYSRVNRNLGINTSLSLEPTANTQSSQQITNNIIVKTASGEAEPIIERSTEIIENGSPEVIASETEFDKLLLEIYKSILLSQNKQLLANILSKHHIMIYKDDLEKVISAKIGRKCAVVVKDFDGCGCSVKTDPFAAIDSIVVYEDDKRVDFKVAYNADYVELSEKYALSLKIALI